MKKEIKFEVLSIDFNDGTKDELILLICDDNFRITHNDTLLKVKCLEHNNALFIPIGSVKKFYIKDVNSKDYTEETIDKLIERIKK